MDQSCAQCDQALKVVPEDLAFYETVSPEFAGKKYLIPPPVCCPDCRMQQRMAWRNERSIHRSSCKFCQQQIISQYPPEAPYSVYCQNCFWSDRWNALDYGKSFDFKRTFMEQFQELLGRVPLLALINTQTENSEYCHRIYDGRNNYLSFIALYQPENLLHTFYTMSCKNCADVSINQYCELCYETTDAERCYNCRYAARIRNCRDSLFLEDCIGCSNCFACKNLHQKQYYIFNEQKSHAEYEAFLHKFNLGAWSSVQDMKKKSQEFFRTLPNRPAVSVNAENATGAFIFNSRNCHEVYDIFESEELRYCGQTERSHHCQDCYGMGNASFCYEGITLGINPSQHILFSAEVINGCSDVLYCYDCYTGTNNCFGCAGLKKGAFCILNKQYTKEEYDKIVPKIIEHMQRTGEWGKFFPVALSPVPYNETVAQEYFPLTTNAVQERGWHWRDQEDELPKVEKIIPAAKLPDSIDAIPDDILSWAIQCDVTKRPFKIIKQELDFYRKMRLPIPRLHPDERHLRRMALRNPRKLWKRNCMKCQKEIKATYSPERQEIVYCEECYLKEVY